MKNAKLVEAVKEALDNLMDSDILQIWNEYCDETSTGDNIYLNNDEFIMNYLPDDKSELCRLLTQSTDYNLRDCYVWYNGYGNLESDDDFRTSNAFDIDDLADWLIRDTCGDIDELETRIDATLELED